MEGVVWVSPNDGVRRRQHAPTCLRTARARSSLLAVLIKAGAGNLQGPYGILNDYLFIFIYFFSFVQNDCVFHCLNIPQNSPNLEYKSHLAKNCIIYCHPEFPPPGGAVLKESVL